MIPRVSNEYKEADEAQGAPVVFAIVLPARETVVSSWGTRRRAPPTPLPLKGKNAHQKFSKFFNP